MAERLTTVQAAAPTYDLTTIDRWSAVAGVTLDGAGQTAVGIFITQASADIAQYLNRPVAYEGVQDLFRPPTTDHGLLTRSPQPLALERWPVAAITQVMEGWTGPAASAAAPPTPLVEGVDYEVDYKAGLLHRLEGCHRRPWRSPLITVSYAAGWWTPALAAALPAGQPAGSPPLPAEVEDACQRLVTARWLDRQRDPYLRAETIPGVIERTYWIPNGQQGSMPGDVADLLRNWRVPVTR